MYIGTQPSILSITAHAARACALVVEVLVTAPNRRAISIKKPWAPHPPRQNHLPSTTSTATSSEFCCEISNFSTSETRRTLENSRLSTFERCTQQCLHGLRRRSGAVYQRRRTKRLASTPSFAPSCHCAPPVPPHSPQGKHTSSSAFQDRRAVRRVVAPLRAPANTRHWLSAWRSRRLHRGSPQSVGRGTRGIRWVIMDPNCRQRRINSSWRRLSPVGWLICESSSRCPC